jgi:hypothetical protein
MADTTDIEKKSLEAHVELCAERYKALELQFAEVKRDIAEIKEMAQNTHELIHGLTEKRNSQLINWGIGIIGTLVAACSWLIAQYVKTL